MTILIWVIIGIVAILIIAFVAIYNGLVRLRNQVKNAWAQIDVQLKRRHDLIPNLIEMVKGYMKYERETLEAITKARTVAQQATSAGPGERAKVEGELGTALNRLLAVAERYPDLKASQNFLSLQEELASTENKISFSRQFYNDSVMQYNNQTQMFPSNVIAGMAGFRQSEFFEVTVAEEKEVPKVSLT
jgi:LemA protein